MILKAALTFLVMAVFVVPAFAEDVSWPDISVGEVKKIDDASKISTSILGTAGLNQSPNHPIEFTFFKAPHGQDYLIIDPCCGEQGNSASLFQRTQAGVKPVALMMGDPRTGFKLQEQASHISLRKSVDAFVARVDFPTCEEGTWSYYYHFDETDNPTLISVIDSSCLHLGVREFYHAKNVDLGHWWMK